MKTSAFIIAASVASANAFVPASNTVKTTALNESLFRKISNMDLFAPVSDQNDYGARGKKNIKTGQLTDKSYIPSGLTKAQYEKIRAGQDDKKKSNYKKNVDKAGIFENYTEFYVKRGTEEGGSFLNMANNGHKMVKTKFDWTGNDPNAAPKYTGVQAADKKPKKKGFFGK